MMSNAAKRSIDRGKVETAFSAPRHYIISAVSAPNMNGEKNAGQTSG
jgi:hypothetical protein